MVEKAAAEEATPAAGRAIETEENVTDDAEVAIVQSSSSGAETVE